MDKLFEKIEALQKKPLHVRRRILYASTAILSALIFVFWLSILPSSIEKTKDRSARVASGTSPFAALIGTVKEATKGLSGVGDAFGEQVRYVREQTGSTTLMASPEEMKELNGLFSTTSPKEAEE